jgi:predicted metal-dependent hydrolase
LGHYDPAHHAIVLSRALDRSKVPAYVVEYVLYHEMLHLKHPVEYRSERRCVHSAAFKAEERRFPEFERANRFLKTF